MNKTIQDRVLDIAQAERRRVNEELQEKLLEIIADYDIEFAAEIDDWLEGKKTAEEINFTDRIKVNAEQDMFSNELKTVVNLDGKPIAEYRLVSTIHDRQVKLEHQINRL